MTVTEVVGSAAIRLADGVSASAVHDASPATALTDCLLAGPVALRDVNSGANVPTSDAILTQLAIQRLWGAGLLELVDDHRQPGLAARPTVAGTRLSWNAPAADAKMRLSRFAFLRVAEDEGLVWETPRRSVRARVLRPEVTAAIAALAVVSDVEDVAAVISGDDGKLSRARGLLFVLVAAGLAEVCDDEGRLPEDRDPASRQWEFHDLLFHVSSRQGLHDRPVGAQYRWKGILQPEPAIREDPWSARAFALPRPDLAQAAVLDPPFTAVLESRRSRRDHDPARPISLLQLSEFLYRVARVRGQFATDYGEFTSRPYPSGGASYELELYITVNHCAGLAGGFYCYDAARHTLSLVSGPGPDTEGLLDEAFQSAAFQCRPQLLITIASRFQRVSWKYSSIAYATQLKNLGVLLQTCYLVATAMNLAGSALGLGNIARFARLTQLEPLVEGSIGEFMLGNPS